MTETSQQGAIVRKPVHRTALSNTTKLAELSVATPQVIAHRLSRMALASPILSARDRREFTGMVSEKQVAFARSWMGMYMAWITAPQRIFLAMLRGRPLPLEVLPQTVVAKGLAPVHQKAVSNAKRLARTKLK